MSTTEIRATPTVQRIDRSTPDTPHHQKTTADGDTLILQTWRAYALVVFAGLFALLALRPHIYRGVWELVIFHKVALTLTALAYAAQGHVPGTTTIIFSDGILAAVLITAYILCRGWRANPGYSKSERS